MQIYKIRYFFGLLRRNDSTELCNNAGKNDKIPATNYGLILHNRKIASYSIVRVLRG